ncbi:MAG: ParB N-terminal domain-containing protein, partial [Terriglobia bacterium]
PGSPTDNLRRRFTLAEPEERKQESNMVIENLPIESITLDPDNCRKHGARSLKALAMALKRSGQQKPIVVSDMGICRAGNGTVMAAKLLGWTHIIAVRTRLTGKAAAEFAFMDNRVAELSEWDSEKARRVYADFDPELQGMLFTSEEAGELFKNAGPMPLEGEEQAQAAAEKIADGSADVQTPVSHVKMVQLYLNNETIVHFSEWLEILGKHLKTDNTTDTVYETLKRSVEVLMAARQEEDEAVPTGGQYLPPEPEPVVPAPSTAEPSTQEDIPF